MPRNIYDGLTNALWPFLSPVSFRCVAVWGLEIVCQQLSKARYRPMRKHPLESAIDQVRWQSPVIGRGVHTSL